MTQFYKEYGLLGNPVEQKRFEKMPWTAGKVIYWCKYAVYAATYVHAYVHFKYAWIYVYL